MTKRRNEAADRPVEAGDLWRNPAGTPGDGRQTAEDVQRPRDGEDDLDVVPGFTATGPSGSQSGRALHGVAPEDVKAEQVGEEGEADK